ncbi:MAG: helix-turn-helix domain-containing protein [Lachnospiraceae bacterium]|nr:helix-turn-helix domain-containing protein [Lachnospiraceae bacterium]
MENLIMNIETVIDYIESHLDEKLDLEKVSEAIHYSKYHLHRMFTNTVGMTVHDYVQRRQLTEAAKLLVFSSKPIIEVAFFCGYESQQAFSSAFKSMYKVPPAQYRDRGTFYPLQLQFVLHKIISPKVFTKEDVCIAKVEDIQAWMDLMRLVIDGYPAMDEADYLHEISKAIEERALILKEGNIMIGAMTFSKNSGSIDFLGIHPQYRNQGIQKLFLEVLLEKHLPGREISMTTYREGDKADTGHRDLLKSLGFAERELLIEYGYPTQRFVLNLSDKEKTE